MGGIKGGEIFSFGENKVSGRKFPIEKVLLLSNRSETRSSSYWEVTRVVRNNGCVTAGSRTEFV